MNKIRGYENIKKLAKDKRCKITDLVVLARQNDPFFTGSPTDTAMAEWFLDLWQQFAYSTGVHLRRIHYRVAIQEEAKKHNNNPYENTQTDWDYLCNAAKYARYLGWVDPGAFVDHRNPEPHIYKDCQNLNSKPDWGNYFLDWDLPSIPTELALKIDWELPNYTIDGYENSEALQPYHLEVWVEKSTMDDVLIPICQQYSVNLVTGPGFYEHN